MEERELKELKRQVDAHAGSRKFLSDLCCALLEHGQARAAIPICRRLVLLISAEAQKWRSLAWSDLAGVLKQAGEREKSLAAAKTAIRLDEKNADAWQMLAEMLNRLGMTDEAHAFASAALRSNAKNDRAWECKAISHWSQRELEGAIAAYNMASRYCPLDEHDRRSYLRFCAARVSQEAGRDGDAARYRQEAAALAESKDAQRLTNPR